MKYCTYISPIKRVALVGLGRFFAARGKSPKWYTFRNSKPQRQIAKLQKTCQYSKFRISISPDTSKVEFAFGNSKAETATNYQRGQSQNLLSKLVLSHLPPVTWLDYPACLLLLGWRFCHLLMICLWFLEGLDWLVLCHWKLRYSFYQASGPIMRKIEKNLIIWGGSDRKPTRRKLFHPYIFSGKWGGHSLWIAATQRDKQLGQDDASC